MRGRRRLLGDWSSGALALWIGAWAPGADAGSQVEEPLSAAVRTALSAAVADEAPPTPSFDTAQDRRHYEQWLQRMSQRLKRVKSERQTREEFLQTVWYESQRSALETALVMGLIEVESGFRKYAISPAGARGYMQVMPFWTRQIGDGEPHRLFHMQTNLRFGCTILRHYLSVEQGDLFMALGRYNGSRGRPEYPNQVLAARSHWI